MLRRDSLRREQIENWGALWSQRSSLEMRGEIAVAPIRRPALRITYFREHNETRQILVQRAEAVIDPRADRRVAAKPVAAIHLVHRRRMIHAVHLAAAEEAQFVRDTREMRPILRDIGTAISRFPKRERASHVITPPAFHGGLLLPLPGELLQVQLRQRRFRIERVDVRWPALHHQENARLGLRGE